MKDIPGLLETKEGTIFKGSTISVVQLNARDDNYMDITIDLKRKLKVDFFIHDDENDPDFYKDIEGEEENFPWVINEGERLIHVFGDGPLDCLDSFIDDFYYVLEEMQESPEGHSKDLIDYLDKMKKEVFDEGTVTRKNPLRFISKVKERILSRILHKYATYFKGMTFFLDSISYFDGKSTKIVSFQDPKKMRIYTDGSGCWYVSTIKNTEEPLAWSNDLKMVLNKLSDHVASS